MKVVFNDPGINERSSPYLQGIANHFSNLGQALKCINDLLGHSTVKAIEIYLNSFEVDVHGEYVKQLMDRHTGLDSLNQITGVDVISDTDG